jgi:hypothetical protein
VRWGHCPMTLNEQLRSITAERKALIAAGANLTGTTPGEIELALRDLGYLKDKPSLQLQNLDPDWPTSKANQQNPRLGESTRSARR